MVTSSVPAGAPGPESQIEGIVAEIVQHLNDSRLPMPTIGESEEGEAVLVWTVRDITAMLKVSPEGCLRFETQEIMRDRDGDETGSKIARGFLSDPGAVDLLMVTLFRPVSANA